MENSLSLFRTVQVLAFDVDGVMTDGRVLVTDNGDLLRTMHVRDGYALQLAVTRGFRVMAISGARSDGVAQRLRQLGLHQVFMGIRDKGTYISGVLQQELINASALLYMGDDVPDLPALQLAGVPVCPADAVPEVKACCKYISPFRGGFGCVRDVIEKVLRLQGLWEEG
ncbi:MAG TPA: HAD hydrolase family protein [Chitinophagaceae bacterium]|nr:HAD hydrolase family protein [Chitinophagaceae bacterium]